MSSRHPDGLASSEPSARPPSCEREREPGLLVAGRRRWTMVIVAAVALAAVVAAVLLSSARRRAGECRRVERPPVTRLHHPERCRAAPHAPLALAAATVASVGESTARDRQAGLAGSTARADAADVTDLKE